MVRKTELPIPENESSMTPKKRRSAPPSAAPAAAAETARAPTYDDVLAIVRLIESSSQFGEFHLRSGDLEVDIRRGNGAPGPAPAAPCAAPPAIPTPAPATPAPPRTARAPAPDLPPGTQVVRSPMVGTFYRAPEPGAAPFVQPGSRVAPDTTVCIIEVMKLMNSIPAGVSGVVTHVFVEDAEVVEFGQPIIAIRPQ